MQHLIGVCGFKRNFCILALAHNLLWCFCLQMGTNKCASQAGMNAYGTRRHLYDPKNQVQTPLDNTTISLQMGTNKGASQVLNTFSSSHKSNIIGLQLEISLWASFIPGASCHV